MTISVGRVLPILAVASGRPGMERKAEESPSGAMGNDDNPAGLRAVAQQAEDWQDPAWSVRRWAVYGLRPWA
jgi:hypothetical protein